MTRPIETELSRELSLFHITMMGVGMMIGAGVFVTTGIGIGVAGPGGILLAFALKGIKSKDYQIMVAVANPVTAPVMVKYANLVAQVKDAELVITSIVTVPYQTPLQEADRFIQKPVI